MNVSPKSLQVRSALAKVLRDASGFELDELNPSGTFLELGFDSLFLIQFSQRIKSALGVKVTFRQLIEEVPTIDSLLGYLETNGKWSDAISTSSAQVSSLATPPVPVAPPKSASVNLESPVAVVVTSAPRIPSSEQAELPTDGACNTVSPVRQPLAAPPMSAPPMSAHSLDAAPIEAHSMGRPPMDSKMPLTAVPEVAWASSLEGIFLQQNQLMMMQLQLLRERRTIQRPPVAASVTGLKPLAVPAAQPPSNLTSESAKPISDKKVATSQTTASGGGVSNQKKVFERFGPYKPVRRSATGGLTDTQQKHLDEFVSRFTKRTAKSRSHAQVNRDHFADPRGVAGYRRIWKSMVYQIAVERSLGSKLWDIDGNEYIDIAMGFGLNLFGQSPPFVTKALHEQLDRGVEVGPQSPLAGEVAKLLCEFSRMDRATFCNTGSEAVMAAMRIARTVTGKTKCVFFNKDYHGNFDQVLLRSGTPGGKPGSSPAAPGVPQFYADNTIVLEYGTEESLRLVEQHADEIAAVLVEPVQSADPDLHPREFLHGLRKITREHNIVMVMDEVISGFRAAPGGAQEYFDVWGDMATYGKILGGGLPIGALAGKSEYMDALDGGTWKYEDASQPEADMTFFAGTFVRHPLAMTAAYQILSRLKAEGPQLQEDLNGRTERLANEVNEFFMKEQIPIRVARFASLFRFIFPPDLEYSDMLYFHLLDRGIFTRGWGDNCFLSTEHSDADICRIIDAVKDSCLELRRAGFLPGGNDRPDGQSTMPAAARPTEVSSQHSSVSNLLDSTAALRLHEKPFRASTLEEIQTEGDLPPLFCMPAADGLTLVYHELSDCLGKNQPVYGLNSPGAYGEPIPETIEEMAERFIADMQAEFPDGPYLLCGYCSGGTIALEMAQQLIAQGKQVAFLAGVETYNWCTAQSSQLTPRVKLIYQIQRLDFHLRNFLLLPGGEKWKFLKSKWNALKVRTRVWRGMLRSQLGSSGSSASASGSVNQAEIWRQHDAQADRYHPRKYPGKMVIFRPKKDYSSYVAREDLQAEHGVEVIRLPVYPAGLMVSPYVSQLAELFAQGIREGLADIQAESTTEGQALASEPAEILQFHVA